MQVISREMHDEIAELAKEGNEGIINFMSSVYTFGVEVDTPLYKWASEHTILETMSLLSGNYFIS